MPEFKVVIATYNNTHAGSNVVAAVVCEDHAVEWVKKELSKKYPMATILVSDAIPHWSVSLLRSETPADTDGIRW